MAKLKAVCDKCAAVYNVALEKIGAQARCVKCQAIFTLKVAENIQTHTPKNSLPINETGERQDRAPVQIQQVPVGNTPFQQAAQQVPVSNTPFQQAAQQAPVGSTPFQQAAQNSPIKTMAGQTELPGLSESAAKNNNRASQALGANLNADGNKPKSLPPSFSTINTRCPRCDYSFPLAKSFLDKSVNCPKCKKPFFAADNYGWIEDPSDSFLSNIFNDKRLLYAVPLVLFLIIGLNLIIPKLIASQALGSLLRNMEINYPLGTYEMTVWGTRAKNQKIHRTADGSSFCSNVAFVHVAHTASGMEFVRFMCKSRSGWAPDFASTINDEIAYEKIDKPLSGGDYMDFVENLTGAVNMDAVNRKDVYNVSAENQQAHENKLYAQNYKPALYLLTKTEANQESLDKSEFMKAFSKITSYDSTEIISIYSYICSAHQSYSNIYNDYDDGEQMEVAYKAHAVMFPQHTDELIAKGYLSERP